MKNFLKCVNLTPSGQRQLKILGASRPHGGNLLQLTLKENQSSVFEGIPRREFLLLNLPLPHKTIYLKTKSHRGASLVSEGLGDKAPLTKSWCKATALTTYSPFWKATTPTSWMTKGSSGAMLRAWPKNRSASLELLVKPYSSPIYSIGKWHLKIFENFTYSIPKTL